MAAICNTGINIAGVAFLALSAGRRSALPGMDDATEYVYADLGRDDEDYAGFDDVRSVAMALAQVKADGLESWLGTALSTTLLGRCHGAAGHGWPWAG